MPSPTTLRLRVCASTSNLGPGFDLLGLALSIPLELEARPIGELPSRYAARTGEAALWPEPALDRLLAAYRRAAGALGFEAPGLELRVHSEIPIGRGLGSSGAATAAGLLLASHLAAAARARDGRLESAGAGARAASAPVRDALHERAELIRLGTELEGHPDNSTASLLGGLTLAVPHAGGVRVLRGELSSQLGFAVAWPASALPTELGRAALPSSVSLADAIENPRRLALLLEGLRHAEPELIALGSADRLHERYRLPLIRGGQAALDAAREAGAWAAMISGSGSALLAIGPRPLRASVAEAMWRELERADGPASARVVEADSSVPRVLES